MAQSIKGKEQRMIRFFVVTKTSREGVTWESRDIIDADVPELEQYLKGGGYGHGAAEIPMVEGVEVIECHQVRAGGVKRDLKTA